MAARLVCGLLATCSALRAPARSFARVARDRTQRSAAPADYEWAAGGDAEADAELFMREIWRRRPVVIRGLVAPAVARAAVDVDAVSGYALEADVTSRLVAGADLALRAGPF